MTTLRNHLTRRGFLTGGILLSAIAAGHKISAYGARQPVEHGDCSITPAMDWYRQFVMANFTALPSRGLNDHLPQKDWQATSDPELGPFLVPPGWTTEVFFANQFERDGSPTWQSGELPYPRWSASMVTSPDQNAFYMHIEGAIDGVELDAPSGASLARELAVGKDVETEALCLLEQYKAEAGLPLSIWFAGETFADHLLMTHGQAIMTDFAGLSGGPGSRFSTNVLVCPYDESEAYMQDVFLRIMWQFVPQSGGGGREPTPTPSPTP